MVLSRAVRFHATGGPEVLRLEHVEVGEPGPGEARVRHTAIGVNFIDTYQRSGLYPVALPAIAGNEGAGVVEALGPDVAGLRVGDRVAYTGLAGAYCERRLVPAGRLLQLPAEIGDEQAAALLLKGMTVQYLIHRTYRVQAGDTVLWHAAAGGVGLIACQWLSALGADVIGTAGTDAKARLALDHGARHVIDYGREDVAARVRSLTGGQGVPVAYDSVGKSTWQGTLDSLRPLGLAVFFGNASGPVPPLDLALLAQKGSLFLTRPTLYTYTASRAELEATAASLFAAVASGKVRADVGARYRLADAAAAHRDLEARRTTGSAILVP